jgi:hypothetical protein
MYKTRTPALDGSNVIRMSHHFESAGFVPASIDAVFGYVDDHERLSSHMSQSSWMMGGGRMDLQLDEGRGQRLGSRIQMSGRAFGVAVSLDEVVSEYDPPRHKAWETVGEPRLLIAWCRTRRRISHPPQHRPPLWRRSQPTTAQAGLRADVVPRPAAADEAR